MRVAALLPAVSMHVGAMAATHGYLHYLVSCGHEVDVVQPQDDVDTAVGRSDVVVSHLGDTAWAAGLAARFGKPNVRMAHGYIPDLEVLDGAALVVFNSHSLAASVDCVSPWIVCHPPVDAARFATTPGDRVTLVNLCELKGGELFWRLVRCAPHRQFLGVNGGYGNQYVDYFPNVEVIATTGNMRDDVYARTRILLMPSERETWGMAAVEAMASGIPVIAHPTGGLVESLGSAGIFVDRADGQAWLDQIERLHDPLEWAKASRSSLARSAELDPQADLDRFVEHIEALHCTGVPA